MSTSENAQVTHMVSWGEGVWVSYRSTAALQLWHTISKKQLQDINIKQAITGIIAGETIGHKYPISCRPMFASVESCDCVNSV